MKIAILSRAGTCYSTRRLREAAADRGHSVQVLDTTRFGLLLERGGPRLFYKGRPLSTFDAVIPRIGASLTHFGTAVVRQLEQMGVPCLSGSEGIIFARDKLRATQRLSRHGIGIPPTAFVRCNRDIVPAIESVGGAPVMIKLLEGTQGVGVILAHSDKVAESIIETLRSARQNVIIQKFVAESRGKDIRAIVVGDRVVAAMRRQARYPEFRSNIHRGGTAEAVSLDAGFERTAIRAARVIGLPVAGVDMLEGQTGPLVTEVNASPGLEGIESATGVNVAGAIVEHLEEHAARAAASTRKPAPPQPARTRRRL
jgi:ribosomal protein S6--L-glutamate ligase